MMPGTREIVGDIRIFRSYIEYTVRDTDPESALAALKDAVKAGEEGWSW